MHWTLKSNTIEPHWWKMGISYSWLP